ncbi:AAA family ATPase [Sorangium sp. So ce134]
MITTPSSGQARHTPDLPVSIGPWRVLAPLGRGGMGVVYRAQHSGTGELAALKTVCVGDASLVSSIRREIHALRGVQHPGVVRILDEGVQGGIPWYAMELLEGRTLRDHNQERWRPRATVDSEVTVSVSAILDAETSTATAEIEPASIIPRSYQPFAPRPFHRAAGGALRQALTLLRAICRPLAYVHGRGVVHRDLKPDNVFIRADGAPVLFDFGLAFQFEGNKGRDELQAGGRLMGSPDYMSPEQIRGDLVDARADLYALGCMLYEAVTGAVPFLGDSSSVVLSMHLYAEPLPASELVADVPPELDALIARLLKKRPEDRLGYADDVATALAALGADDAPPPPGSSTPAPAAQPYLYRPRLAGRGEALGQISQAIERANERRQGSLVLVGGESGVGKTRLAVEAVHQASLVHMAVVTGACAAVSAEGEREGAVKAAPLHPFRPLLLAVADRCNELGPGGYDALLGPRGRVLAPYEPSLAQLRGHERYPEPPELPPDAARFRLRTALADTLAAFAATRPVLLVLDDLQWADENSRDVLEHLDAAYFAAHPVVLLGAYRTEEAAPALAPLLGAPWTSRIELGRLDRASVGRMVRDMLALDEPPEPLVRYLFEQSEGNPFFIAEYLRAAIQERMIYRDEAYVWRIRASAEGAAAEALARAARASQPPPSLPLPGSLRALVARRLSGLSPGALALARLASALGRELEERLLLGAAGLAEVEAMDALAELAGRHVLEEAEPGQLRFVHDKLREVVYAGIPEPERRALHGAAARAIEQRHRDAPDLALSYPLLAHHYAIAGVVEKTLEYLDKAGAQALATGASGDAVDFYRRALYLDSALSPEERAPPLRRARWERRLGQAHYNLGDLIGAERHCAAALELLSQGEAGWLRAAGGGAPLGDRLRAAAASMKQLGLQLAHVAGLTIPVARDAGERERLAEASLAAEKLSETYLFRNEPTLAFLAALAATNAAARLGPSLSLARGYAGLSVAFGYVPWKAVVDAYAARATEAAAALDDPRGVAFVSFLRGLTALGEGRCRDARALLTEAERLAEALQDRRRKEECITLLAGVAHTEGRWVEALDRYGALAVAARASDNAQGHLWAESGRAQCRLLLGDGEGATAIFDGLSAEVQRIGDRTQQITHGQVALGHLLRGARDEARAAAERTLPMIREGQPAGYHCLYGYAATCEVLLALLEEARAPSERRELGRLSAEACRALGRYARIFPLGRSISLRLRGLAAWLAGGRGRARRLWAAAIDEALRRGLPVDEARARFELARHLERGDPRRERHVARAVALFAALDLQYWRERVARLRERY